MQRILITGSQGALGFYLKRAMLERNVAHQNELFGLSRNPAKNKSPKNYHHIQANMLDSIALKNILTDIKPDKIFHLAWETSHGSYWYNPANEEWADASIALATRFCEQGGDYFSFAGTCAEYAWGDEVLEEATVYQKPATLYGREKLRTTEALLSLAETAPAVVNCCRLFFPFSPRENENRITSLLVKNLLQGEKMHLKSGDVYRSICHTRHVAQAMCNIAESGAEGIFNLVPKGSVHLGGFLKKIATEMGAETSVSWNERSSKANDPLYLCGTGQKVAAYFPSNIDLDEDVASFTKESIKRFTRAPQP